MEFFDDASDADDDIVAESPFSEKDRQMSLLSNAFFIELMKLKPYLKAQKTDILTAEILIPRELLVVIGDNLDLASESCVNGLCLKLKIAKFDRVTILTTSSVLQCNSTFDIIVDLLSLNTVSCDADPGLVSKYLTCLMPGGKILTSSSQTLFNPFDWIVGNTLATPNTSSTTVSIIQKRCVHCNQNGALYWRNLEVSSQIQTERDWLEKVSVPITVCEFNTGTFSDNAHKRAVHNILTYGVCIFPHLFNSKETMSWGQYAKNDMKAIVKTLKETRNIDLLNPCPETPRIENFHELSMREALRCDLRNGKQMKLKAKQVNDDSINCEKIVGEVSTNSKDTNNSTSAATPPLQPNAAAYYKHQSVASTTTKSNNSSSTASNQPPCDNLRHHPAILSILSEAMNPIAPSEHERKGNWGRYNFEGAGPEVVPAPKIGQLGVVMSLPGCADQTIHADTSHIFVHTHLPPHYLNLFTPAVELEHDVIKEYTAKDRNNNSTIQYESYAIGQTCFVVGSHTLDIAGRVMTTEEGQGILEERLIRPQLNIGDALIFDCRILHFGLANQSAMIPTDVVLAATTQSQSVIDESEATNTTATTSTPIKDITTAVVNTDSFSTVSSGWRPMLYVNYHHDWFHDPKNWNDAEKLFVENA